MYPEIEFSAQLCVPENVKFSSNHIFSQKCNDFSLKIGYTIPCREGGAATVLLHMIPPHTKAIPQTEAPSSVPQALEGVSVFCNRFLYFYIFF